jgi:hypothetical protein
LPREVFRQYDNDRDRAVLSGSNAIGVEDPWARAADVGARELSDEPWVAVAAVFVNAHVKDLVVGPIEQVARSAKANDE